MRHLSLSLHRTRRTVVESTPGRAASFWQALFFEENGSNCCREKLSGRHRLGENPCALGHYAHSPALCDTLNGWYLKV